MDITPASSAGSDTTTSSSSSSVDTASIAASVISDVESGNNTDDTTESTEPETTESQPTEQADPDDFDSTPAERVDVLGRKRENSIPHGRVKTMIARREQKLISDVAKAMGISKAEAELKLEDVLGEVTQRNTKFTDLEGRIKTAESVEAIMEQEPERFIQMLAQANPAYQRFAALLQQAAADDKGTKVDDDDPEPQPDYPLKDANGNITGHTFTLEGLRKRDEWKDRQFTKKILGQIDQKLSPFETDRKERAKRQRMEEIHTQASDAVKRALEHAQTWPGFTDNQKDIAALIDAKPTTTLHEAYMQIVMPKLSKDRNKMREELIAEINGKPKSTSTPAAPASANNDKGKSTSDIAREVMKGMGV